MIFFFFFFEFPVEEKIIRKGSLSFQCSMGFPNSLSLVFHTKQRAAERESKLELGLVLNQERKRSLPY